MGVRLLDRYLILAWMPRVFKGGGGSERAPGRGDRRGVERALEPVGVRRLFLEEPQQYLKLPLMAQLMGEELGQDLLDGDVDAAPVGPVHLPRLVPEAHPVHLCS